MRTVLAFDLNGNIDALGSEGMSVRAIRSPYNVAGANRAKPFKLTPSELPAWGAPKAVRERGQLIRERLCAHAEIKELLTRLDGTPITNVNPLFVLLSEGDAELISWETLCNSTDEFVALDRRWPIGRITDPMCGRPRPPATFGLPVRVMGIISAFGVHSQAQEWNFFRAAVLGARRKGVDVRLKLLVGHPELRDAIDGEIRNGLTGVEVSHIDKTGSRVIHEIIDWDPNVVHFFCHGIADPQSLELATGGDYADPSAKSGTVKITTDQLVEVSFQLRNPWLLTLNCCACGKAGKDLQSMAHQIVSAGFPAAVAMLEPVDASDAHEFTRAFYSAVFAGFSEIKAELEAKRQQAPFEWVNAMRDARIAICQLHDGDAENSREWTLPVLYVRGVEPFGFVAPDTGCVAEDVRKFHFMAGLAAEWLRDVRHDTDDATRIAVIEKTLADVPKAFWPKLDGTFPGN